MTKTKNGYTIILNEWDNIITIRKNQKLVTRETFSNAITAKVAYSNI